MNHTWASAQSRASLALSVAHIAPSRDSYPRPGTASDSLSTLLSQVLWALEGEIPGWEDDALGLCWMNSCLDLIIGKSGSSFGSERGAPGLGYAASGIFPQLGIWGLMLELTILPSFWDLQDSNCP